MGEVVLRRVRRQLDIVEGYLFLRNPMTPARLDHHRTRSDRRDVERLAGFQQAFPPQPQSPTRRGSCLRAGVD